MPTKEQLAAFEAAGAGVVPPASNRFGGEAAAPKRQAPIKMVDQDSGQITEGETIDERQLAPSKRSFAQAGGSLAETKAAKAVTSRTRGVEVPQTMDTAKFAGKLNEFHKLLSDRAREVNAKAPTATAPDGSAVAVNGRPSKTGGNVLGEDSLERGNSALAAAKTLINKGDDFRFGNNRNGHNPDEVRSVSEAHKHYQGALASLATAHKHLHSDSLTNALGAAKANISTESIHPLEIAALQEHAKSLQVLKPARAYSTVQVGKNAPGAGVYKVGSPELETLKKALPEPIPVIGQAERGTARVSAAQKARKESAARSGFVPPASKPAAPVVRDPRSRASAYDATGTGVMAQQPGVTPKFDATSAIPGVAGRTGKGKPKPMTAADRAALTSGSNALEAKAKKGKK